MIYTAQSQNNNPVQIATGTPAHAAAIYVRALPYCRAIEHVIVTDPAGNQTAHDIDTAAELSTAWMLTAGDAWSDAA